MKITTHKELRVWQTAMELAMKVFEMTKSFPRDERFSMTDQIRRASRSVAANLAEAWRKRRYAAAFISKLNDSEAEAAETQTFIELALRSNYVSSTVASELDSAYEQLLAQLVTMARSPEKWTL